MSVQIIFLATCIFLKWTMNSCKNSREIKENCRPIYPVRTVFYPFPLLLELNLSNLGLPLEKTRKSVSVSLFP